MNNTGITKSSSGASSDGKWRIGAGICGLATAKGIKSLVFERSETLRNTTGTAILFRQNGMRALDQLGVAETLRHTAIPVQREREVWLVKGRQKEIPIDGESLCLRRKHLIDTLYAALPSGTVQFGRQLESIKLDLNTARHVLKLIEGSFNIAKVVIGCDGANSVVSCTPSHSLPIVHLRYRAPWDLLTDIFCKGTVTVAGDAMHVMAPFLGQGGSAGLEDAVVLARNMAQMGLDHKGVAMVTVWVRYEAIPHGNTIASGAVWFNRHGLRLLLPKRFAKKGGRGAWPTQKMVPPHPNKEVALAKAWVHISTCRKVGNEQTRDGFWKRILEHFKTNVKDTTRTHHSLNTKWGNLNTTMGVFNGLYIQSKRLRESGCSDLDVMKNALADYEKKTKGKDFTHIEAWEVVRGEDKWLEQPCVGQEASASSEKRRKSLSSSYYETGSNDNVETVLPDLKDDTTPTRKTKGKKAESFDSTNESIAESFDNYVISKTQILESIAEKRSAKDDLAEKLLSAQIRNIEEKAYHRALKFYNQPHDHINDPRMREITIAKKREYAEK